MILSLSEVIERETKRARLFILLAITANDTSSLSGLTGRMGEDLVPMSRSESRRRERRREYVVNGLRDEEAMVGVGRRDEDGAGDDDDAQRQTDANTLHVARRLRASTYKLNANLDVRRRSLPMPLAL